VRIPERSRSVHPTAGGAIESLMARAHVTSRLLRGGDPRASEPPSALTAAERLAMMWPLALDAWAFKGEPVVEPRLPRPLVRLVRGGR
jgi:hypothetical protein